MKYLCSGAFVKGQKKRQVIEQEVEVRQVGRPRTRYVRKGGQTYEQWLRIQRIKNANHYYCLLSRNRAHGKNHTNNLECQQSTMNLASSNTHTESTIMEDEQQSMDGHDVMPHENMLQMQGKRSSYKEHTQALSSSAKFEEEKLSAPPKHQLYPRKKHRQDPALRDCGEIKNGGSLHLQCEEISRRISTRVLLKQLKKNKQLSPILWKIRYRHPEIQPAILYQALINLVNSNSVSF